MSDITKLRALVAEKQMICGNVVNVFNTAFAHRILDLLEAAEKRVVTLKGILDLLEAAEKRVAADNLSLQERVETAEAKAKEALVEGLRRAQRLMEIQAASYVERENEDETGEATVSHWRECTENMALIIKVEADSLMTKTPSPLQTG